MYGFSSLTRPGARVLEEVIDMGAYEYNLAPVFNLQPCSRDFHAAYLEASATALRRRRRG